MACGSSIPRDGRRSGSPNRAHDTTNVAVGTLPTRQARRLCELCDVARLWTDVQDRRTDLEHVVQLARVNQSPERVAERDDVQVGGGEHRAQLLTRHVRQTLDVWQPRRDIAFNRPKHAATADEAKLEAGIAAQRFRRGDDRLERIARTVVAGVPDDKLAIPASVRAKGLTTADTEPH